MQTKTILATLLILASTISRAQDTTRKTMVVSDTSHSFTKIEIESEYPGGNPAWIKYMNRTLRYPDKAVEKMIQKDRFFQFENHIF